MNLKEFAYRMGYPMVTHDFRQKMARKFSQFREDILSMRENDEMPIEVVDMAYGSFKYPRASRR